MITALRLLALLPRRWLQLAGGLLGRCNAWLGTRAAKVTEVNIALCFPAMSAVERHALAKQSLIGSGKTLLEAPAIWLGNTARIDRWVGRVHNEAALTDALAADAGLLLLLPHTGNWELFNVFFRRYGRFTALYNPPRNARYQSLMAEVRRHHGNDTVPTDSRGIRQLYRVLDSGGTVVVLPDQVPGQGRFVSFFGQPALTDELSCRLAKKTGAVVVGVCLVRQEDGCFDVHFLPVGGGGALSGAEGAALETELLAVNQFVETAVRLAPSQYQWEYKRFRARPEGGDELYRFN